MVFQLFCMALIALLFGQALVFGGYRLFIFLLPIWGFFFGFGLAKAQDQIFFFQSGGIWNRRFLCLLPQELKGCVFKFGVFYCLSVHGFTRKEKYPRLLAVGWIVYLINWFGSIRSPDVSMSASVSGDAELTYEAKKIITLPQGCGKLITKC